MAHWSSTIISVSSWKYIQIPAKTVKCTLNFEKNIRFPHNIAHLIVEEGWRRRARDKFWELYSELFTEIVLQLGRVYILSLCTSKNISLLNLLVSQFCAHEVNCVIIQAPRNFTLYPFNIILYLITVAAARGICHLPIQTRKWNYLPD